MVSVSANVSSLQSPATPTPIFTYVLPNYVVNYSIIQLPPPNANAIYPYAYNIVVYGPPPFPIQISFYEQTANGTTQEISVTMPIDALSTSIGCTSYPTQIVMMQVGSESISPSPAATLSPSPIVSISPTSIPTATPASTSSTESPTSNPTSNPEFIVSLSESASALNYGVKINFTATADGGIAPYTFTWYVDNQTSGSNSSPYFTIDSMPVGSHHVYVLINDANGNSAITNTVEFNVLPTSNLSPSPSIPEFPAWIILPLAAVTILLIVTLMKNKKSDETK